MTQHTDLEPFTPPEGTSHVEVAAVNYDQWILTVSVWVYNILDQTVSGVIHVVFEEVEGFRLLDEGSMLGFPWADLTKSRSFVHRVDKGGWLDFERSADHLVLCDNAQEYVIVTDNECVSVIAYAEPTANKSLNTDAEDGAG